MARNIALVGVLFFLMIIVLVLVPGKPTDAQSGTASFRARIERLNSEGTSFVVRFTAPVAGAFDVTLSENSRQIAEVGDDYFCFSEPWNDTRRTYCTPYANVTSVSFVSQ